MTAAKTLHIVCAYATGLGFLIRGLMALKGSPLLNHPIARRLPHAIDTVLLGSALTMVYAWSLSPQTLPWLSTKIVALAVYIAFGFSLLRFGSTALRRYAGFVGGLITYFYIVAVAHTKTPWPWLTLFSA